MTTPYEELLGTGFDGTPADDPYDVIYDGHDEPGRALERVPGLTALLGDPGADDAERMLALVALVSWAEPAGYRAVVRAAADPRATPWYGCSTDRWFSADRSYGLFAEAAADSRELAEQKGTTELRTETFRALIGLADREGFDDRLGDLLEADVVRACLPEIREVIARGIAAVAAGDRFHFDVETQLADLACAVTRVDGDLAVDLLLELLGNSPSGRTLRHAAGAVGRLRGPAREALAARLRETGNAYVREVLEGLEPA
ncbi:hypothetical protein AB0F18_15785 [Streptomyces sp. NPDC029216]|uniref:hypothetical protein n=1 Tax=Streptomyces sp. NPDC029216 TaxID=3154701 RepID=UPI00340F46FF